MRVVSRWASGCYTVEQVNGRSIDRVQCRSPAHLTQFDINLVLVLRFLSVEGAKGYEYLFLAHGVQSERISLETN